MHRLTQIVRHLEPQTPVPTLSSAPSAGVLSLVFGNLLETEQHGGELVAKVLKAHNVPWVFTLAGGHISPILVSCRKAGIRVVDVRHEVTSVFAADAVARLTGVPGVAAVTAGPGITNTITAVKNAQMAQSPVVLFGGAAATNLKGKGALQDIDQMAVLKPIVKFAASVNRVSEIVPTLRKAFQEALSGVPGPVFIEFPLDVLYPLNEVRAGMGMAERLRKKDLKPELLPRLIVPVEAKSAEEYLATKPSDAPIFLRPQPGSNQNSTFVNTYLEYTLNRLFAGAFDHKDFGPLPIHYPHPQPVQLQAAAGYLRKSTKPVLLLSSQSMLNPKNADALKQAIETLGIPVYLGGMARGLMGKNHPLHLRQNRGGSLRGADVVILAGTVCDFRMNYGRALSRKSSVIAVNRSKNDLLLNSGIFWSAALACLSDPAEFVIQLAKVLGSERAQTWGPWIQERRKSQESVEKKNQAKAAEPVIGRGKAAGAKLLNPLQVFLDLEDSLPDDSILVADGGDFVATASYILHPRGALRWLDPGAFGTLGVGGGFALGAKLARPSAQVWLIWGDGSAGYSLAEFDTFKRHNVPIIALIGNDACWTQIEREQVPMFQDDVGCALDYTPYHTVAEGYGGHGMEVGSPSGGPTLRDVIKKAQELANSGVPVCINAHIGRSDFREGSISV